MRNNRTLTCEVARKVIDSTEVQFDTYQVPIWEGMTVLDVMRYIADNLDGSFSYYDHDCKRGFCGSCLLNINGKKGLSCRVLVPDLEKLRIEPAMQTTKDFWPTE